MTPIEGELELFTRELAARQESGRAEDAIAVADRGWELLGGDRLAAAADTSPLLDAILPAMSWAEAQLPATHPRRAAVTGRLGTLLALRYLTGSGRADDRDRALVLLAEAGPGFPGGQVMRALVLLISSFPTGALAPLRDLAVNARSGHLVDNAALHDLAMAMTDGVRDARVREALTILTQPTDEVMPPELADFADGLRGLAALMLDDEQAPVGDSVSRLAENWAGPGRDELAALAVLAQIRQPSRLPAHEELTETLSAAVLGLPPGHAMRVLLQSELAEALMRQAMRSGTGPDIEAAVAAFADGFAEVEEGHLLYDHMLRSLAGAMVSHAAVDASDADVDQAMALAAQVASKTGTDPVQAGRDRFLVGMARMLHAVRTTRYADMAAAIDEMTAAAAALPPGDELAPTVQATLGAAILDRYQLHGALEDLDSGMERLNAALAESRSRGSDDWGTTTLQGLAAYSRVLRALRLPGEVDLAGTVDELRHVVGSLPPGNMARGRAMSGLGLGLFALAVDGESVDLDRLAEGCRLLAEVALVEPGPASERSATLARAGLAHLAQALLAGDCEQRPALFTRGIDLLHASVEQPGMPGWSMCRNLCGLAFGYELRAAVTGSAADLDEAIEQLELAYFFSGEQAGHAATAALLRQLSRAYWNRNARLGEDRRSAVVFGLEELRARTDEVLLQSGTQDGLLAARGAAERAYEIARWCGELDPPLPTDAVEALELGRGLVLYATTVAVEVPELLRRYGHPDLAEQWLAERRQAEPQWDGFQASAAQRDPRLDASHLAAAARLQAQPPSGIRLKVVSALMKESVLRSVPTAVERAAALASCRADALVYLVPEHDGQAGFAMVQCAGDDPVRVDLEGLREASTLTAYGEAEAAVRTAQDGRAARRRWREALGELCDWAWPTVMEPVLSAVCELTGRVQPAVVLVPCGTLAAVPWHAARSSGGYAIARAEITFAASCRQLCDASRRELLELGTQPVLVGNPGGDLIYVPLAIEGIRDAWYPDAVMYGQFACTVAGRGTAAQVLAHMPGAAGAASLLHLGCHAKVVDSATGSYLDLADGQQLSMAAILHQAGRAARSAPGGLVILSACTSDLTATDPNEALTLANAFMAAGAGAAVGTRWKVQEVRTAIFTYALHAFLREAPVTDRPGVRRALHQAQRWMADPARRRLPRMPDALWDEVVLAGSGQGLGDLEHPESWAGFILQGA
ncbi:CHAT domain-containing protein [Catellatospora sp. KI3]|uniref:CHAT domain-containing protein n=1 Tax=Catellatospora sp. KI3 TaxID=3041620 RepID=UPI002483037D|nr:CHAT domain-containing protein [Catellatospora sp. KI3]MDI1462841.1 CHAT domain-containing protein [Catellatospora sp. KI3]